jgi:GNAT superfamily N-acetyltransferase
MDESMVSMDANIQVIDYSPNFQKHFEYINKLWIEDLFALEDFDQRQLQSPEEYIIEPGGAILFAAIDDQIVGTVGLTKINSHTYELIKMGVLPSARGKKVGQVLVNAALAKAKMLGATDVVLYTNTKLAAAISIYKKVGFVEVQKECGKYERCDLKMTYHVA